MQLSGINIVAISSACGYYTITTGINITPYVAISAGYIIFVAIIATAGSNMVFVGVIATASGNMVFVAIIATAGSNMVFVGIITTASNIVSVATY